MEKIKFQGHLLACIVRKNHFQSGYNFISDNDWLLQVGVNFYEKGQICVPHEHHIHPYEGIGPEQSLELLYFVAGGSEVSLFWQDRLVSIHSLEEGDAILLVHGGHALKMNKHTKILEVKQGPYNSRDKDKRIFLPKEE